jgi:hypothetical protein
MGINLRKNTRFFDFGFKGSEVQRFSGSGFRGSKVLSSMFGGSEFKVQRFKGSGPRWLAPLVSGYWVERCVLRVAGLRRDGGTMASQAGCSFRM